MILKQERRRTPVLNRNAGLSAIEKPQTGFRHIPGVSFEDVRVRYSSADSAKAGARSYSSETIIFAEPEWKRSLPGNELLPVQMCQMPGEVCTPDDGEAELEDFISEDDDNDHYNVATTSGDARKEICHISTEHIVAKAKTREELREDASGIWSIQGRVSFSENTTVVCAVFRTKGGYLHIVTVNDPRVPPKLRVEAEKRGYVALRGAKTHAEANLLLYTNKHSENARLMAFGCDKDSCPQCEELLHECGPAGLDFPVRRPKKNGEKRYCSTYYFRGARKNLRGEGKFVRRIRGILSKNYEDGRLKKGAATGGRRGPNKKTERRSSYSGRAVRRKKAVREGVIQ